MSTGSGNALDLVFASVGGRTALTRRRYRWPLLIGRVFVDRTRPGAGSVTIQNCAGTVIPGDGVRQRIEVVDGGSAVVRGQGATIVSGVRGGEAAVEDTRLRVDASSRLVFDPSPRILTAHARYRQRTQVCVEPGGRAVIVDAVVLHPDMTNETFGSYESSFAVTATDGTLLALDAQMLETTPRVRRAPTAFATVYVVGGGFDDAMTALSPDLESRGGHTGGRRAYLAVTDLPNQAGWAVRIAGSDGGTLRSTIAAVLEQVVELRQCLTASAAPDREIRVRRTADVATVGPREHRVADFRPRRSGDAGADTSSEEEAAPAVGRRRGQPCRDVAQ